MPLNFHEKQGFNVLLSTLCLLPLFLILSVITYRTGVSPLVLSVAWISLLLLALIVYFSKLNTRITEEGLTVSFFPFLLRPKHIKWAEVRQAYLREYLPLSEYGGWGAPLLHPAIYKGMGNSRAFNTKGREGLQLELKDGRFYLIGTQKRVELQRELDKFKNSGTVRL